MGILNIGSKINRKVYKYVVQNTFFGLTSFRLKADQLIFDIGCVVDKVCEGSMIGVQCQLMICRGHTRASKGALQIFSMITGSVWKLISKSNIGLCLHFGCDISCQSKHGLSDSSVTIGKFITGDKNIHFWFQNKKMPFWDGTLHHLHSEPSLYTAWKCRGPKSLNRIKFSWFVQVLLYFLLIWVSALGRGHVGWRYMGPWGYMGAWGYPHMNTHTHAHAHMHTHAHVKEIVNGCQHVYQDKWLDLSRFLCGPCGSHVVPNCPYIIPCHPHVIPTSSLLSQHCLNNLHLTPHTPTPTHHRDPQKQ